MLSRSALADAAHQLGPETAADGVAAKRQRQAGHFLPPLAQIHDALQPGFRIGELAFVNDQPGFVFAFEHLRNDLIEGNDFGFNPGREEFQREIGGGQRAGDGDLYA